MSEQQPIPPRRRLQELQAIPERQRSDEQWDEINELEIALSSVNRTEAREPNVRRNAPASPEQAKPGGGAQGKKPFKKFPRRVPKDNSP